MDFVDKPLVPIVPAFTRQAPTHIYVPIAAPGNPGLAEYNPKDFDVSDGKVQLSRDVRQLLAGFDIGMQVAIKYALAWANGKKYTTSTTLPSDNFVESRFMAAVEYELGTYTFTKNEDGWWLNGYIVNLNTYGITPINDNSITIELSIIDDPETDTGIAPWYHNNAEYWAHHPDPIDTDNIVDGAVTKIKLAAGLANSIDSAAHDIIITRNAITQTVTVSLKNESGDIIATSSVVIPGSDIDTSNFAKSITLYYTQNGGFVRLWYDTRNADGAMISESYIDLPIPSSASSENPLVTKANLDVVEAVAKGRATGYVFDTKADMDEALEDETFTEKLVLGDNLYIRATDTPDYWWDGEEAQMLETQKVDLSEYRKATAQDAIDAGKLDKVTTPAENARVYSIGQNGGQSVIETNYSPVTGDIARWDTGGKLRTGTATENNHAVQLSQMNTALAGKSAVKVNGSVVGQWDADTKVDKMPSGNRQMVYIRSNTGSDTGITYSTNGYGSTFALRDGNGVLRAADPVERGDCATKGYVDDTIASHDIEVIFG